MESKVAIGLVEKAISDRHPQRWADLGAGDGTFTRSLSALLGEGSTIYAIDKSGSELEKIQVNPSIELKTFVLDFENDELPFQQLNGIMMANSLHYVKDKIPFVKKLKNLGRPGAALIIIEYDMDVGNRWVPYPISYSKLEILAEQCGFTKVSKMAEVPSAFRRANIYSAWLQ
jgi:SAM-dependent methyltransferase